MVDLRPSSRAPSGRRRRRYRLRAETQLRTTNVLRQPKVSGPASVIKPEFRRADNGMAGRRFLIVSAPFGPFGMALASVIEQRGGSVERMIFNAGDAFNWRRKGAVVFKDGVEAWPDALANMGDRYTDIIVFGEGGPYNRAVLSKTDTLEARVWVLENGYFRPDWITVERNGVNASSGLPRMREGYASPAPELPVQRQVGKILPHHVVNISLYHLFQALGRFFYPQHANHYTASPVMQCVGHIRRYFGLALRSPEACDADRIAARGPFFIACLQREGDGQLLRYSEYADNTAFMAAVITSFAANAPADARLVVKNHPLDPGLINLAAVTRRLAQERGVADRVEFIDGGNLARLCRASRGMIVNNSSAALSALGFQTPVKVLGDAFFDFSGLTDQQPLDGFWKAPQGPESALFARFRAHVIASSQVNGNYHEPRSVMFTANGVADVFERAQG